MENPTTTIYLIRHGQTEFPFEDKFYKSDNGPGLNDFGREQAKKIGVWLKSNSKIETIYSSQAKRSSETAAAIMEIMDANLEITQNLEERNLGQWEGKTIQEIKDIFSEDYDRWKSGDICFSPPEGESLEIFCNRVNSYLDKILEEDKGKEIAVVTHAGPIRCFVQKILNIDDKRFFMIYPQTGTLSKINFSEEWTGLISFGFQPEAILE